jgi:hypothetical protein
VDWNNDGTIDTDDTYGLPSIGLETKFTGHFDGQYHSIQNAFQNAFSIGLFNQVRGATIEKLQLLNFDFTSDYRIGGGIIGEAYGEGNVFHQLLVEGSLDFSSSPKTEVYAGGIVGRMVSATMTECVAKVTYTGKEMAKGSGKGNVAGGLVAQDFGGSTISDSYSVSTIAEGWKLIAGLIGISLNTDGTLGITNCYSGSTVSNVAVAESFGSFAGELTSATVASCYWDSEIQIEGVGSSDTAVDVTGLATTAFNTELNFVDWDFTDIWKIGDVEGVQRPYLQWQDEVGTPLSVDEISLGSLLKVYPNPVTSRLTIENAPVNAQFSMTNLLGQELISGTVEGTSMHLNVESYNKGIYILRVGDQTNKIIIE